MKTVKRIVHRKLVTSLAFFAFTFALIGQSLPQIEARFTNPRFEKETRKYYLDVELTSLQSPEALFGMNLRFYYDASMMDFQGMDEFQPGYGVLGSAPKSFVGNEASGVQMFSFGRSAAYVNGAVQLLDNNLPLVMAPGKWVKAFRVGFKVPIVVPDQENFCPSVIWDLKPGTGSGGFLPGGDGLVITVTENQRDTREESAPCIASGIPFNWKYNFEGGMPYGQTFRKECISIAELVSTEDQNQVDANGYALYQNMPNPFDQRTIIEFILPFAQEATLKFYDVNGKIMEEIKGHYPAGKNQFLLKQKVWMEQSNVLFYRLETADYSSAIRKMSLVRA